MRDSTPGRRVAVLWVHLDVPVGRVIVQTFVSARARLAARRGRQPETRRRLGQAGRQPFLESE